LNVAESMAYSRILTQLDSMHIVNTKQLMCGEKIHLHYNCTSKLLLLFKKLQ